MRRTTVVMVLAAFAGTLSAFAQDWLYVPTSYTDTKGNKWGTISDGNWKLCVTASGTSLTTKGEGNTAAVPPFAVEGTGTLDLSKPIRDANGTEYKLTAQRQSMFWKFNASEYGSRTITSFVSSRDLTTVAQNAFHTASDLTTCVFSAPLLQYIENQAFRNCSSLTSLTLDIPYAKYLGWDLTTGAKIASDASAWRLDSITNLQPRAFNAQGNMTGALYFPSLARVAHQAFINCTKLKGLVLGSENPSGTGLVHVGADTSGIASASQLATETTTISNARASGGDVNKISVAYGVKLDFLVIGKGEGQVLDDYAFSGITYITNIFFCGDKPTFGTTVFRHVANKYAAIYIPPDNDTYAAAIASVTEPTAAERAEFEANHAPGTLIGMVAARTHFSCNAAEKLFLAYGNYRQYLNDIVVCGTPSGATLANSSDLWWECNRTIREIDTAAAYTLSAPAARMLNGTYRYVSGYTLETATLSGWSAPVTHSGTSYVRPAGMKGSVRVTWIWGDTAVKNGGLARPDDATWSGDTISFVRDGMAVDASDYATPGTYVLTPSWTAQADFPKSGFLRWENIPEGATTDAVGRLTFAYDGTQKDIRAVFRHDWVYDASAGTIWNRRYRLNVTDIGGSKLGIGTSDAMSGTSASGGNAFILSDSMEAGGHLDLNGLVTDSSGAGSWTLSKIGYQSLAPWALTTADARVATHYPTHIRVPETLEAVQGGALKTPSWDYTPLTNLVVRTPLLADTKSNFAQGHRYLYRVTIDLPGLTTFGQAFVNCNSVCLKDTDVTEWNLPNVQVVNSQAFGNNCTYPNVRGTLDLPKVRTLSGQALSALSGVDTMILGTNGNTLVTIGNQAFWKCNALKKLVIGAKEEMSVGTDILPAGTALETIEFSGKMPPNASSFLDKALAFKTVSSPGDYVRVIGSRERFMEHLLPSQAFTPEEEVVAPEGAYGVYVTGDTSERKAWLVDDGTKLNGLRIIFR